MSRARAAPREARTLPGLLKRLGDIPSDCIPIPPGTVTEDDLIAIQARREGLFERSDGRIVEKAVGTWEATVTSPLVNRVGLYLDGKELGFCVGPNDLAELAPRVFR